MNINISQSNLLSGREYRGAARIDGPLVTMRNTHNVGYGELVELSTGDGKIRLGQVLDTSDEIVVVQVFEGTDGLSMPGTGMRFLGEPLTLAVSEQMLGRVMNGLGKSRDGSATPQGYAERDVNGEPINPTAREYPRDFIQTGISVIDGLTTLIQGQKLPIFSGSGLSHNQLAAQIARQAKVRGSGGDFATIFVAMGVKYDVAKYFIDSFEESGVLDNVALFLSLADDPSIERIITPKTALTLAEHLAFDKGKHVLVIMTDMTNYCESLREIGTLRGEIPSRKGYPGYLYSNLAEIYERSEDHRPQRIDHPAADSSMPNDDISHRCRTYWIYHRRPDRLERGMHARVHPPINPLPSLSRLIGRNRRGTLQDHPHLANQLFALQPCQGCAEPRLRNGEEELTALDQQTGVRHLL